jgi:hypothetical protein
MPNCGEREAKTWANGRRWYTSLSEGLFQAEPGWPRSDPDDAVLQRGLSGTEVVLAAELLRC